MSCEQVVVSTLVDAFFIFHDRASYIARRLREQKISRVDHDSIFAVPKADTFPPLS